jgi:plasmid stabilization system protein ParE
MPKAKWTSKARDDLRSIGRYIGQHDKRPSTAEKIIREIAAKCDEYSEAFFRGSVLGSDASFLADSCRIFAHKRWVIVFEPNGNGIEVLRIFDGSRDFPTLFGG